MKNQITGTSLAVQCLGFCAFTSGVMSCILGQGTRIPHAAIQQKKKKKEVINSSNMNNSNT